MSLPFLLEIGTEEIPDWMIKNALEDLRAKFVGLGIPHETVQVDATPRRLVLRASGLPERQADSVERVQGPSKSAPPQAVEGFARKQGAAPADLAVETTPKGEYYVFHKKMAGRATKDILAAALPGVVLGIYFPKTMYWTGKSGPRFIRPIRWLVALLGDEVVPFEIGGVRAGNLSAGHRRLGAAQVAVTCEDYERRLRENCVILSADERRARILQGLGWQAEAPAPPVGQTLSSVNPAVPGAVAGAKVDPALLETLTYLTEYPTAIEGGFDPAFLELPSEVLVTVMRHHQRYFSVEDAEGKLLPRFFAVMNIGSRSPGLRAARQRAGVAGALHRRAVLLGFRSEEDAGRPAEGPGQRDVSGQAGIVPGQGQAHEGAG